MSLRQTIETRQSLVITADLRESIKILQLSTHDLSVYVQEHVEKNPLINIEDDTAYQIPEVRKYSTLPTYKLGSNKEFDYSNIENEKYITLREHVLRQINYYPLTNKERIIAIMLADYLDDSGYLKEEYVSICQKLKCNLDEISQVLILLHNLEPAGVFARNVGECLKLQLIDKNLYNETFQKILDNLDMVAALDIKKLQKICKVSPKDVTSHIMTIKSLNPKPGNIFCGDATIFVQPDVILHIENEALHIEVNHESMPKISLDKDLYEQIKTKGLTKDDRTFLSYNYNNAKWLINSIEHRNQTLLEVSYKIVEKQKSFFLGGGIKHLKPMMLQDIADETGLSLSTVSRITRNKYIATPMGLFEFKYFFSGSIVSNDSDGDSSKKIKLMIKKIIELEKADAILTDDNVVLLLAKENINISRRTVAKYRDQMKIPSSAERKKSKRHLLLNDINLLVEEI